MPTIKVNNLGFMNGPSINDAYIPIEVSDEEFAKTANGPMEKLWQGDFEAKTFNLVTTPVTDDLRVARSLICFPVMNRGYGGYRSLSEEQLAELDTGYQAGLDVTETGEIPEKPDGLK